MQILIDRNIKNRNGNGKKDDMKPKKIKFPELSEIGN
jgi:hypothetical protein